MNNVESIHFLLFRGKWENEGVFNALETEKDIVIFSTGKDYQNGDEISASAQQIGKNYLKEKKDKIKAIVINNSSYRSIGLLDNICLELGHYIPIYTSYHNKIIINSKFPKLRNRILLVENEKNYQIGEFSMSFLPCSSYNIGNLGTHCQYKDNSFFFLDDFCLAPLLENELLNKNNFVYQLKNFFDKKKENSYLVTSCQNIHWYNDNSIFFIKHSFPIFANETPFFILYDFDWLHILELLEIIYQWKRKIIIVNSDFFSLIKKILFDSHHLKKIIFTNEPKNQTQDAIYLLTTNPQQSTIDVLDYYLQNFKSSKRENNFHFIVGLPPVIGGEEKLDRFIDYLYQQSKKVTNLSRKQVKRLNLGISLNDLQLVTKLLNPNKLIVLNNSYKSKDILNHLSKKTLILDNNHYWDVSKGTQLVPFSPNKKNTISLEEILLKQRQKLKQSGLFIVCSTIFINKEEKRVLLQKVHLEKIAIPFFQKKDISILSNKINNWWEKKIVVNVKIEDDIKTIKTSIEKRINSLLRNFINNRYNREVGEIIVLIFVHHGQNKE